MGGKDILSLLKITPSPQSVDYVHNKKQFQLHTLLTEQRHPKTWNVSFVLKDDVDEGLGQILSVDEDIAEKFFRIAEETALLDQAVHAVNQAIKEKKKIFLYGCGATGRLAKQMESAVWRPFWGRIKKTGLWGKIKKNVPADIEDRLIGEMTGGDRALISSLEGLEDLQLVGKLQLQDRGIQRGDVVFGITEGGETSSVIGAVLAALEQYGTLTEEKIKAAKTHLYFVYNNPDDVIKPFERSRSVIENPAITKINLTTGPQAITGSTRMQAATSETFLVGIILEAGIQSVLRELLSEEELNDVGFPKNFRIGDRLRSFCDILEVLRFSIGGLSAFTRLESETYRNKRYTTYFAREALVTVFTDCTERSPTFHLYPLDTIQEMRRKCWFQVWTEGKDQGQAWKNFLGRDFRGLEEAFYMPYFCDQIDDAYLKDAAIKSLSQAGNDQEHFYDLSFSSDNIDCRGPQEKDLAVMVCLDEEIDELSRTDSSFSRFASLVKGKKASLALIIVGDKDPQEIQEMIANLPMNRTQGDVVIPVFLRKSEDPLKLNRQILLKILLNAHSTAVMARMGRVVGNTMTNVDPSNLKLIGRATYLIMSHVNDTVSQDEWARKWGKADPITYDQANAVLFEAMDYVADEGGQSSEVELAILRILEALKNETEPGWEDVLSLSQTVGLEEYLGKHNPALRYQKKER
jgi:N-acetylmuramic acid 6-phosphate (MurNAc-6-P) etherase